jgi:biopolymer transport protein ExbD
VSTRVEKMRALRMLRDEAAAAAAGTRAHAHATVRAEINVTPLVDVVLVLLIIFMVVTPLIASGVAVDLPRTAHHARKPDDGKDVIVSITADKRFFMGATRVGSADELARTVLLEKRRAPDKAIFIKADSRAPYGLVRQVLEALHAADIQDVVLGTEELERR